MWGIIVKTVCVCVCVSHRDAAVGECSFNLTVLDCLQGIRKVNKSHDWAKLRRINQFVHLVGPDFTPDTLIRD